MKKHIKTLGDTEATISEMPARLRLDIRVQPGGLDRKKIISLKKFGERYQVEVQIAEF